MVDIKEELLAPCGLYCSVCRIYLAHKDNDIEEAYKILGMEPPPEELTNTKFFFFLFRSCKNLLLRSIINFFNSLT